MPAGDLVIRLVRATGIAPYFLAAAGVILAYGAFMAYYLLRVGPGGESLQGLEAKLDSVVNSNTRIVESTSRLVSSFREQVDRLESLLKTSAPELNSPEGTPKAESKAESKEETEEVKPGTSSLNLLLREMVQRARAGREE